MLALAPSQALARNYELKFRGSDSATAGRGGIYSEKTKHQHYTLKLGPSSKIDSTEPLQIRAATVLRNVQTKKSVINDIATYDFTPTNHKAVVFSIYTGAAGQTVDNWKNVLGDDSSGYQPNGVVVEVWQSGKCLKHLSGTVGNQAKTKLEPGTTECAMLDEKGLKSYSERYFENKPRIALD